MYRLMLRATLPANTSPQETLSVVDRHPRSGLTLSCSKAARVYTAEIRVRVGMSDKPMKGFIGKILLESTATPKSGNSSIQQGGSQTFCALPSTNTLLLG